jgi:periplasmic copper chaperone A
MRFAFFALAAAAALTGCDRSGDVPVATNAWIRLPAVTGRPAAAYVTIQGGRKASTLNTIRIPAARRVELHESMSHDGAMSMQPVDRIAVPAGAIVELKPGGMHAMLFDMDTTLKAGGTTKMTLLFDTAPPIELDATLVAPGGSMPE